MSQQVDELRVLHWNIHSWRDETGVSNVAAVAKLIQATDPHVVSLVEVDEPWGRPSRLDDLATRTGYSTIFVPSFEFGEDEPGGGFGNALLSSLPIRDVRHRQLMWPPRLFDGTEPSEGRSIVFAHLQSRSTSIWVGTTHLPRDDQNSRAKSLQRVKSIIRQWDEPWLLVGDFNTPSTSWLTGEEKLSVSPVLRPTYPAEAPVEPIDYCIAHASMRIQADVLSVAGSDHLPVLVRAQIPHNRRNQRD